MKRILFTTTNLGVPTGGSEVLWAEAASKMAKLKNHSVATLVRHWIPVPKRISQIVDNGGFVFYFPDDLPVPPSKIKILINRLLPSHLQFRPVYPKPLLHAFEEFCPDLVIVTFGDFFQRSPVLDHILKNEIPYVTNVQLVNEYSQGDDAYLLRQLRYFEKSLVNCFISKKNLALAEQLLGSKIPNAKIIKNPCSEKTQYLPYPSTDEGYRLAFPARLHTFHKGLDVLLKVMAQQKWKARKLLVNVYGDGPNRKQLGRLRTMWGVENVNFLPHTNDIADVWKNHHGLVVSSRMEGHPMVAVEAMACGRMVIMTNVGLGDDLVNHHENGFVAESATAHELDATLEEAWSMRKQWSAMGESALLTVKGFLKTDPVFDFINIVESNL